MESLIFDSIKELKRENNLSLLEKKLKVKISIAGKKVTISGEAIDEYEAMTILEAINFGFQAKTALILKEEDIIFRVIPIKHFTNRKNLEIVKARIIGTQGKTKKTIEHLADCKIVIKGNNIAMICPADEIENATTALTNLIRGAKQANVYKYLEKINKS